MIKANLGLIAQGIKGASTEIVKRTKQKVKQPVKVIIEAGRKIKRNPKKSAAIGAAVAGTGFYLYGGKRNAYEDDEMM